MASTTQDHLCHKHRPSLDPTAGVTSDIATSLGDGLPARGAGELR